MKERTMEKQSSLYIGSRVYTVLEAEVSLVFS